MPWESVGSVDTGQMPHEEGWILFCLGMAKSYVAFVCGEAPDDAKLDIMRHDHELGSYPSLGVWYEFEEPCEYIRACEDALSVMNESVSWLELKEHFLKPKETEDDGDGYGYGYEGVDEEEDDDELKKTQALSEITTEGD